MIGMQGRLITVSELAEAANVGRAKARRFLRLHQPGQATKDARLQQAYDALRGARLEQNSENGHDFAAHSRG